MSVTRLCFFLSAILLLSGCFFYSRQMYHFCVHTFKQPDRNAEQRRQDLSDCEPGRARFFHSQDLSWWSYSQKVDESRRQYYALNKKIAACMKSKGYTVFTFGKCNARDYWPPEDGFLFP